MTTPNSTFEDYLREIHAEKINCTDETCLDDDMEDAFEAWFEDLDSDDLIKYADLYGRKKLLLGQRMGLDSGMKIFHDAMSKV